MQPELAAEQIAFYGPAASARRQPGPAAVGSLPQGHLPAARVPVELANEVWSMDYIVANLRTVPGPPYCCGASAKVVVTLEEVTCLRGSCGWILVVQTWGTARLRIARL